MAESKKAIYDLIPPQYYPKTEIITEGTALEVVFSKFRELKLSYPIIAKPDIGLRGSAVRKIYNDSELLEYHQKANFDYLIQGLIPFPNEIGIFYVRYPNEKAGKITGMVGKEFLIVVGDGVSTIDQLIKVNPRFELQRKALIKEYGVQLSEILTVGEQRNLVPYGNHARGAKFLDVSHLITSKLTAMIDGICKEIPEFYFGRLDIMFDTFSQLESGENFSIVEVNGAGSEPTHIYDPKHSIVFAWKELMRHISYMYEISAINHKNGVPYLTYKQGMAEYKLHLAQSGKISSF